MAVRSNTEHLASEWEVKTSRAAIDRSRGHCYVLRYDASANLGGNGVDTEFKDSVGVKHTLLLVDKSDGFI